MEFLKSGLWEIKNSFALRYLGAALGISHMMIFWKWHQAPFFKGETPICWSFYSQCGESLVFSASNIGFFINSYLVLAVIATLTYITLRGVGFGHFLLLVASLLNLSFYLTDFSLANDTNVLVLFLSFYFVFLPQKARLAKAVVIISYWIWGALKINQEWMAGFWLTQHLADQIPVKGIEWVAAITLFAEIVLPFFLISKQAQRFFTGAGLLLVYNLFKGYIVGEASTIIHVMLLLFFAISYFEEERKERERIYQSFIRPEPSLMWVMAFSLIFIAWQGLPQTFLKDKNTQWAMTFTKYPVPVECQHHNLAYFESGVRHLPSDIVKAPILLLKCKAHIYREGATKICDELSREKELSKVSSYFLKRNVSDKEFTRVFELDNACEESSSKGVF